MALKNAQLEKLKAAEERKKQVADAVAGYKRTLTESGIALEDQEQLESLLDHDELAKAIADGADVEALVKEKFETNKRLLEESAEDGSPTNKVQEKVRPPTPPPEPVVEKVIVREDSAAVLARMEAMLDTKRTNSLEMHRTLSKFLVNLKPKSLFDNLTPSVQLDFVKMFMETHAHDLEGLLGRARDDLSDKTDDELDKHPMLALLQFQRGLSSLRDVVGINFYAETYVNMRRHFKLRNRDEVAQQNALAK